MKLFSYNEPENKKSVVPVAGLGGCWVFGSLGGGFRWSVYAASGCRGRYFGGHLLNAQGK